MPSPGMSVILCAMDLFVGADTLSADLNS
jgi:hypothetical protein